MIEPATRREREELARLLSSSSAEPGEHVPVRYRLRVGNREFRASELSDIADTDGTGLALSGAVPGGVPASLNGKRVRLDYLYGAEGIAVPGFTGKLLRSETKRAFAAASTGGRASDTPLMQPLSYPQSRSSDVLYDAARRLPYDRIDIAPVAEPLFDREDAFAPTETVQDVYDAVEDACGVRVVTDPRNWAVSLPTKPLDAPGHEFEWEVGRDIRDDRDEPFEATLRGETGWAAVRIWREIDESPGIEWLTDPVPVLTRHGEPPEDGLVYTDGIADTTPEAYGRALERAMVLARLFSYGDWQLAFTTTRLDARMIRGDRGLISHVAEDEEGRILRRFRAVLTGYERDPINKRGRYTADAVLLSETRVPTMASPGAQTTQGAVMASPSAGVARLPWGLDHLGRPYFDTGLDWVTEGPTYLELDTTLAAARGVTITEEGDTIVVSDQ